jgi:sulfonate transport system substrate-binding protein
MQGSKKPSMGSASLKLSRRAVLFFLGWVTVVSTGLVSCKSEPNTPQAQKSEPNTSQVQPSGKKELRLPRAKGLAGLGILERQGNLEKALKPLGFTVKWIEFPAGPQQFEALNAGALDVTFTAESPPIFAQVGGVPFVYLAAIPPNGKAIGLVVAPKSPIQKVSDLKGKKIAFQKASIGHYLLVRALEKENLSLKDIESVNLPPTDAGNAFLGGKVDAWFIWDPFLSRLIVKQAGRTITDGKELNKDTPFYYSVSRQFYQQNPEVVKVLLQELDKTDIWIKDHPKESVEIAAELTQLPTDALLRSHSNGEFGLRPITPATIAGQQKVADLWYKEQLIPKKVNVEENFLKPEEYSQIAPKEVLIRK